MDAPVSGGTVGTREGTLTIMLGGDEPVLADGRSVLEQLGSRITRITLVGPVGAGQVAKAANQLIVGGTIGLVAEALTPRREPRDRSGARRRNPVRRVRRLAGARGSRQPDGHPVLRARLSVCAAAQGPCDRQCRRTRGRITTRPRQRRSSAVRAPMRRGWGRPRPRRGNRRDPRRMSPMQERKT